MSKFRYVIFPNRVYTLEYEDGYRFEVTGQQILDMFYRNAQLDKLFFEEN
jgi:hypothetical protein